MYLHHHHPISSTSLSLSLALSESLIGFVQCAGKLMCTLSTGTLCVTHVYIGILGDEGPNFSATQDYMIVLA